MTTRYSLRIPDALYERIKAAAERDQRSAHAEILWLLDQALRNHGGAAPAPDQP